MNDTLASHYGKRIRVTGIFERYGSRFDSMGRTKKTVLLGDITLEGSSEVIAVHVWLQDAGLFAGLEGGEKVTFEAAVDKYKRHLREQGPDKVVDAYGLYRPSDVKVSTPPVYRPQMSMIQEPSVAAAPASFDSAKPVCAPPASSDSAKPVSDPLQLISQVQRTAKECGGWDKLKLLVEMLAR
jgi:hypothetical protein